MTGEKLADSSDELLSTVEEMLDAARGVKGELFANTVAAVFDLLQASATVGLMQAVAKIGHIDLSKASEACAGLIAHASARILAALPEADAGEAQQLANHLLQRRDFALAARLKRRPE